MMRRSGLWVPKRTPEEGVAGLNAAVVAALNELAVRKQNNNLGL